MGRAKISLYPTGEGLLLQLGGRHAIAATALHGQPFGFTREDVALLREHFTWDVTCDVSEGAARSGTSLADRIEALLPPEDA